MLQLSKTDIGKLHEVNALLASEPGKKIAFEMMNDPDYTPVATRAPSQEEQEQIDADAKLAEEQAEADAVKLAEEQAAAAAVPVEPPPPPPPPAPKVLEYQVDEEGSGRPIGRPTRIVYTNEEELIKAMKAAHVNATRYAERMKKNRTASTEAVQQTQQAQVSAAKATKEAEEALALAETDKTPTKIVEAAEKKSKAQREIEIAEKVAEKQGGIIAEAWMDDHAHDFVRCTANSNIIGDWLKAENKTLTYDNLELAFIATERRLAKPTVAIPAPVSSNTIPVAPVAPLVATPAIPAPAPATPAVIPPAPPAASSVPAETVPTPVAAVNPPAARRPGVNGGIPPGTLIAPRTARVEAAPVSTKSEMLREIAKMPRDEYRRKLKDANYIARLRAAGIPVVSQQN